MLTYKEEFIIIKTCYDYDKKTNPHWESVPEVFSNYDEALEFAKKLCKEECRKLNKGLKTIAFRYNCDEEHDFSIRFCEGDKYHNVMGYDIFTIKKG